MDPVRGVSGFQVLGKARLFAPMTCSAVLNKKEGQQTAMKGELLERTMVSRSHYVFPEEKFKMEWLYGKIFRFLIWQTFIKTSCLHKVLIPDISNATNANDNLIHFNVFQMHSSSVPFLCTNTFF